MTCLSKTNGAKTARSSQMFRQKMQFVTLTWWITTCTLVPVAHIWPILQYWFFSWPTNWTVGCTTPPERLCLWSCIMHGERLPVLTYMTYNNVCMYVCIVHTTSEYEYSSLTHHHQSNKRTTRSIRQHCNNRKSKSQQLLQKETRRLQQPTKPIATALTRLQTERLKDSHRGSNISGSKCPTYLPGMCMSSQFNT